MQQTPSMHWPLAHWFAPPHAPPLANPGWHTPAAQKSPDTQSVSETQLPRHAVGPQTYGLQPCVCCAGQLPAPILGYDVRGDMTNMTDASGQTWTWTYDPLGRQHVATDPAKHGSTTV